MGLSGFLFRRDGSGTLASKGLGGAISGGQQPPPAAPGYVYPAFALEMMLSGTTSVWQAHAWQAHAWDADAWQSEQSVEALWQDVSDDVRAAESVVCEYGIQGNSPSDRVASTGTLSYLLDNSENNSAETVGYYSLLHPSKRGNFILNTGVRFSLSCDSIAGGASFYKFLGKLSEAPSDPGAYGDRLTHCQAVDLMDDYATTDEPDMDVQQLQTSSECLTTMLSLLVGVDGTRSRFVGTELEPRASEIEASIETHAYAFDGGTGQRLTIRERMNQLALSEYGKIFFKGDRDGGGTLAFHNRRHGPLNTTVLFALDNDMSVNDGLVIDATRAKVFRSVQITIHPTNNVSAEPIAVLYQLTSAQVYIGPFQTNDSIVGTFSDPVTNDAIGGTDFVPIVAGTDYVINTAQDGSGIDLTASGGGSPPFTVVASTTGYGVSWSIANAGSIGGFVTVLQLRGRPIRRTTLLIEANVDGGYGPQTVTMDMPYQTDTNVGNDIAIYLARLLSTPSAQINSARFLANTSVEHMAAALTLEPGDRVSVKESVTAPSAVEVSINAVRLELEAGNDNGPLLWCTWSFDSIAAERYWLLGIPGSSELDTTTRLGI